MVVPRSTVHIPVFTLFHVLQHLTDSLDYDCLINYLADYAMTTFSAQLIQLQHQDKSNFSKSKDDGALGS